MRKKERKEFKKMWKAFKEQTKWEEEQTIAAENSILAQRSFGLETNTALTATVNGERKILDTEALVHAYYLLKTGECLYERRIEFTECSNTIEG